MKNLLITFIYLTSGLSMAVTRQVELRTEKINDAIHWKPEKVQVAPGETIEIVAKHDVEGGFDFHGLFIPVLKVSEQVNRHKELKKTVTVPADLKPGDYPIGCQFHPKHVPATLIVKKK